MIVTDSTLISKKSVDHLKKRLLIKSISFDGGVTLRRAMRRNGNPSDWIYIFKSILNSTIIFRFENHENSSFSDSIFVDPTDVANQISRRAMDTNIDTIIISCQTASEILCIKPEIIANFVRYGLIIGKIGSRNSELLLEDVLRFQNDFILNGEICEIIGGNWKSNISKLCDAGYEPTAIVGSTPVWRRSDFEEYLDVQNVQQES